MDNHELEIDFTEQIQLKAEEKAGYPPNCNDGYEASEDGKKCVPIKTDEAKTDEAKTKKKKDW